MKSFLKNLPRIARAAARHGPANISLVRHIRGEAYPVVLVEDRGKHSHVRRMRAATEIRMIRNKSIAFIDLRWRIVLEQSCRTGRKRSHVQRQDNMLSDDFASGIQNRAACVLRLADNRGIAGAKERVLHLLDNAGKPRLDDL